MIDPETPLFCVRGEPEPAIGYFYAEADAQFAIGARSIIEQLAALDPDEDNVKALALLIASARMALDPAPAPDPSDGERPRFEDGEDVENARAYMADPEGRICGDCGRHGVLTGHMGCPYPQDHA